MDGGLTQQIGHGTRGNFRNLYLQVVQITAHTLTRSVVLLALAVLLLVVPSCSSLLNAPLF